MTDKEKEKRTNAAGITYGNVSIGETTSEMSRFHGHQGHGYAAERAEHIHDLYHGNDARIVGDDNAKNGADRIVNGVEIQSKYCASGAECVQVCFRDGKYRYYSKSGEPMKLEVPLDKYDDAVSAMRRRIESGQVDGVTDPNEAENIVKKGNFTYDQAKGIAKAGTIDSLKFDAQTGMVVAGRVMGISAMITFAVSMWNGDSVELALQNAALSGLKIGGAAFVTTVITSQILRTPVSNAVRSGTDYVVSKLGPKATALLENSLKTGTNVYGSEAAVNVSKLLSGTLIASTVSLVVLSAGDIINAFRGRISVKQLAKNVTVTGATIAGGGAGYAAGSRLGEAVGKKMKSPMGELIGSKVGGVIGGAVGGALTGKAAHSAADHIAEDDADEMKRIVEHEFAGICEENVMSENEVKASLDLLQEKLTSKELKNIYASDDRAAYVRSLIDPCVDSVLSEREVIVIPEEDYVVYSIRTLIEDAADGTGLFDTSDQAMAPAGYQQNVLQDRGIRDDQLGHVMQPVVTLNRTAKQSESVLENMKRDEADTKEKRRELLDERDQLKADLDSLFS